MRPSTKDLCGLDTTKLKGIEYELAVRIKLDHLIRKKNELTKDLMDRYSDQENKDYEKTSYINGRIVYLDKAIAAAESDLSEMEVERIYFMGSSILAYSMYEIDPEKMKDFEVCDASDIEAKCASKSDGGGGANYYDLPPDAKQLLDLIEYRNMNGNIKDIFKACYRLGQKDGTSVEYDMKKMVLYSIRELGRVLGRKDYINLAIEVAGHHDTTRKAS